MMSYSVRTNTEEVIEVEENIIAFEEVQVAVLDCRSGRPLANKKVKRIVVKQDDVAIIDVEFDRTVDHALTVELADALKKLGFNDAEVKKGYKKYWAARDSSAKAADAAGEPFPVFEARVIDEYKRHRATDDNGILTLQLPRVFFNGHSISVEVGFWDFPVFLEAVNDDPRVQDLAPQPIRRDGVDIGGSRLLLDLGNNGTRFDIVWTGREQSTDWNGNWGWEARRVSRNAAPIAPASGGMVSATYFLNSIGLNAGAGNQEVDMATEFKVSETIILKNNQAEVNMKTAQNVSILDSSLFSMFYVKGTNNTPFVLYGMEWCQPVWDGIEDSVDLPAGSSNGVSVIRNAGYSNKGIHIVTLHYPQNSHSGIDYGTYRHARRNRGVNEPVDVHINGIGTDNLFAIHGGQAFVRHDPTNNAGSWAGRYVKIDFEIGNARRNVRYLHMHEIAECVCQAYKAPNDPLNVNLSMGEWVMAGTIIGLAGITGFPTLNNGERNSANNFQPPSNMPSHCHMDGLPHNEAIMAHSDEVDRFNRFTIPNDTNHPLLLPCSCHFSAESPEECDFRNDFANQCWAAIRQRCPHLDADGQQVRRLQTKLRLLGYYNGPMNNVTSDQLALSIQNFKSANRLAPINGDIPADEDSPFFQILEELVAEEAFGTNGSVLNELQTDINT